MLFTRNSISILCLVICSVELFKFKFFIYRKIFYYPHGLTAVIKKHIKILRTWNNIHKTACLSHVIYQLTICNNNMYLGTYE